MKKAFTLLLAIVSCIILLSACEEKPAKNAIVNYETGCYYDKNWDDTVGTYADAVIPDKETALEMAKAIFSGMKKGKEEQEYVPQSVFYDDQDEVWIVSFWENSDAFVLGGGCSIAMQKSDGKVLRIWFGE